MNELEAVSAWAKQCGIRLITLPHAEAALDAVRAGAMLVDQLEGPRHSLAGAIAHEMTDLSHHRPAMILCAAGDLTTPDQGVIRAQFAGWPLVIIRLQDLMHDPDVTDESPYACDWDTTVAQSLGLPGVPLLVRSCPYGGDLADETATCCAAAARHETPVCLLTTRQAMLTRREHQAPTASSLKQDEAPGEKHQNVPPSTRTHGDAENDVPEFRPLRLPTGEALEETLHCLIHKVAGVNDIAHADSDIDPDADTLVIAFGLAAPPARTAVQSVRDGGGRASLSVLRTLWPIPEKTLRRAITPFVRRALIVEQNPGLYARILRAALPSVQIESLCRFDGRPIDPAYIARRITDWPCG